MSEKRDLVPHVTLVGAGAVGLCLGARLADAGLPVHYLTRAPEAARALEARGVRLWDPVARAAITLPVRASADLDALPPAARSGLVLLCTRASETERVVRTLCPTLRDATWISAQNDVDNEQRLSEHVAQVIGLVVRQTCTRAGVRLVRAAGPGRVVLGDHPTGFGRTASMLADAFERVGVSVGRSHDIGRDKWLKLCVNLMSAPNALVRRSDHDQPAFVEIKVRLLEEAQQALAAAAILATPCDDGDRDLEGEIAHLRASLSAGTSARPLPLYNAVWTALMSRTTGLEADLYHDRILALADRHGLPAPTHLRVRAALLQVANHALGPEGLAAEDLLA